MICERTCAPCDKFSCLTEDYDGICEQCAQFEEAPEIVKRPLPRLTSQIGARMIDGPITAEKVIEACDRLDRLLEDLFVGRAGLTAQNYQMAGDLVQIIRIGAGGGKK